MMNRLSAVVVLSLLCLASAGRELPECARIDKSSLVFPGSRDAQDRFYAKLDSLVSGGAGNVNVWHVGGSHVQAAFFPNRIMNTLDSVFAMRADRGFLFPRRLARTNSDKSYRIAAEGKWEAPMMTRNSKLRKPRYGITGFGARTSDPGASVGFNLNPGSDSLWCFDRLRLLGYASSSRAYPYVVSGADTLRPRFEHDTESYVFDFPGTSDSALVRFNIPQGESFVLNGLQPLSGKPGINYFCSGVNGAKVLSWVDRCEDLERDLRLVKPDLAILGLGINDSACRAADFDPERFKANYRRLISMVHRVSGECALIFVTNNDSYRYVRGGMTYNENAAAVRKAMMELAQEYGAAVWDLYGLMGGRQTVLEWRDEGLVKPDRLHFTDEGYELLGDLFCGALLKDYSDRR